MRLIDADELPVKTDWHKQYVLYTAIEDAPTIDAVPVVRCKDCVKRKTKRCAMVQTCLNCGWDAWTVTDDDDFCSYGERKEAEENG